VDTRVSPFAPTKNPKQRKKKLWDLLTSAFNLSFDTILVVEALRHCTSENIRRLRIALKPNLLIFGKNSIIKKFVKSLDKQYHPLLRYLRRNTGLLFATNDRVGEIIEQINKMKYSRILREGDIAPEDVMMYAGTTNLDPHSGTYFSVVNIATRIRRGKIDLPHDVLVIKRGEQVTLHHEMFFKSIKLAVTSKSMVCLAQFINGCIFPPLFWEKISDVHMIERMYRAYNKLAALSFASKYQPTELTIPHLVLNCYQNLQYLSSELGYEMGDPPQPPTYFYSKSSALQGSSIANIFS